MADVIVTLKIMPTSPEIDLDKVKQESDLLIKEFGGEIGKVEIEPVAFGIKALKLIFIMKEDLGGTDDLEKQISEINGVNSVEAIDVRRSFG